MIETLSSQEQKRLQQVEGIIFDIQRYSTHDGPGLRTDIFLKAAHYAADGVPILNHKI